MSWYLVLILGIATLFYAAFPAIGAFMVRAQWRTFRRIVTDASRYPTATPSAAGRERAASVGLFRFFGTLEAIQGDDRIWITNGRFSVAADLRGVRVYLIPEGEEDGRTSGEDAIAESAEARGAESARARDAESAEARGPETAKARGPESGGELRSVPWSRIFSLPEGTPVFVGGALFAEEGRAVFRDHGGTPLLVVIHDCPRESIVIKAIGSGRQRNEYMNAFTLPSVAIGALSLILLAFSLLAAPAMRIVALIALTAGLAPISPFLPPGFPLYFAYRSNWKKARLMRAQRDIVRLPLRYFPSIPHNGRGRRATLLPDMEPYLMVRGTIEAGGSGVMHSEGVPIQLPAGMARLQFSLPGVKEDDGRECVAFAAYREEGEGIRLQKPDDPMAEQVLVTGDPETISGLSERIARRYTVISGLFISLNLVVNIPLLFLVLSLVIR
jgi:hypothetical protein